MSITRAQFLLSSLSIPFAVASGSARNGGTIAVVHGPDPLTAPFRAALEQGNAVTLAALIDADPALAHWHDERGIPALVLAAIAGFESCVAVCRERGAQTGLMESVICGDQAEMARLIGRVPGLARECNAAGWSPLHAAARFARLEMLFQLGSAAGGFDVLPEGTPGVTPMTLALRHPDRKRATRMAQRMLANGADPNPVQEGGVTPLHVAAETGNEFMITMLIRKGASVDARDAAGRSPLEAALEKKHSRSAEIIRAHASIARDHDGTRLLRRLDGSPWTATPTAIPYEIGNKFVGAAHTNLETVRIMLADFPNIHALDATWRELGIEACAHTGRTEIVAVIAEHGAPVSLATATVLGRIDLVKRHLADDPACVRERGPHDYPLLAYPALGDNLHSVAELLLEAGVDVNAANANGTGLHYAARSGDRDLVALYLSYGADKGLRRLEDDATAREVALKAGYTAVAALL